MVVLREMRRRARELAGPVLGIAATFYFAYHMLVGDRSVFALLRVNHELNVEQADLSTAESERAAFDHKVTNMRPDHLDPDLLDQTVRATLDFAAPNEIILMRPSEKR